MGARCGGTSWSWSEPLVSLVAEPPPQLAGLLGGYGVGVECAQVVVDDQHQVAMRAEVVAHSGGRMRQGELWGLLDYCHDTIPVGRVRFSIPYTNDTPKRGRLQGE